MLHGDQEAERVDACGNQPSDGIGPVYGFDGMICGNLKNRSDPDQTQTAGTNQRYQHGQHRITNATERTNHHFHHAAEYIELAHDAQTIHTCGNDCGIIRIDSEKLWAKEYGRKAYEKADYGYTTHGTE